MLWEDKIEFGHGIETEIRAHTTGHGMYVDFYQSGDKPVDDHVMIFPEDIDTVIEFLQKSKKTAAEREEKANA